MEPIVSPWVIYFLSMCTGAKIILFLVGLGGACTYLFLKFTEWDGKPKVSIVTLFVFITLLGLFVPDEDVATKMLIAQNVTYERVEMVGDTVQDVYEDIIALVDNNEVEGED